MGGKLVAAVEIGTSKTVVLASDAARPTKVLAMSEVAGAGMRRGEVFDFKQACKVAHEAFAEVERCAGAPIATIFLAATGAHFSGIENHATVRVRAADNYIDDDDIVRAQDEAKAKALPLDRIYVNHFCQGYNVDRIFADNPVGMRGDTVSAHYWSTTADGQKLKHLIDVVNSYGLDVAEVVTASVAAGSVVTDEAERRNGVLVIDMGAGTTDYMVYKNNYVQRTGVLPVGGEHVTNDLSIALRISCKLAEKIKIEHGKAMINAADSDEKMWLIGDKSIGDRNVRKHVIYQVIHERVVELFQYLKKDLGSTLNDVIRVVLTGGASRLHGVHHAAQHIFEKEVRLSENMESAQNRLREPEYSTVLGLLHTAQRPYEHRQPQRTFYNRLLALIK